MRIPIAETDIGYWQPIGEYYWFQLIITDNWLPEGWIDRYKQSTWAEFKEQLPFPAYPGAPHRLRRKTKYKGR